ncbi:MAG: FecR domain-containing protein [Flavobacteriaceae bacterium]
MKQIVCLIIWFLSIVAFSQEKATFSFINTPVKDVLFSLEKNYNIRFSYADDVLNDQLFSLPKNQYSLKEILAKIEEETHLNFKKLNTRYFVVSKRQSTLKDTQQLSEIVVANYLTKGIYKNKKGFYKIDAQKTQILPGLLQADILESLQQLPGVVSPNETTTGLVVRGGTSDQNRILWDGINIYHNGHLFGMISPFNPAISQIITFHNKGTNPEFGERISSVIDIKTTTNIAKKLNASINLNGLSASAFVEVPLVTDRLSLQLSARRSFTDIYQSPTFNKLAHKVFQETNIETDNNSVNDFYFTDYNVKLNYQLNAKNRILASAILIDNQLDYSIKNKETEINSKDILTSKNEGYAIEWQSHWTSKIKQNTSANFSKYKLNYNFIQENASAVISNFDKRNVIYDTNLNTNFTLNTTEKDKLTLGYQYSFKDVGYAFLNTTNISLILDYDDRIMSTQAFYANYSLKNKRFFNVDVGFRLNHYLTLDQLKFEPRFVVYKNIYKGLKLQVTGEIKNQVLSQIDETVLSNLSLENRLWKLADGETFPIINSAQISAGLLYQKKGWSFDVDHYYKNSNGITALSLGFLNPDGKTFRIGKQKITGVDFYVKKNFKPFTTWVSYSYTDVKSRFKAFNSDAYFAANTNISHAVSTSLSYKVNSIEMALGWRWRTGKPYTKAIIDDGKIHFEGINTERLPNYHRLDFSSTYNFKFSKKNRLKGKLGWSIRNVYNQQNHLSKEYSGFNTISDPIKVRDMYSLGFTPNLFFGVYW